MNQEAPISTPIDAAAAARLARFGRLPERIRAEDTTQGVDTGLVARVNGWYDPEGQWQYFSCLALDLGL
ncbi:hypothetical protein ACH4JS_23110 [Streptomyces sp. NPDC017638]|uniref:hypothetical protein n=1 Tax=Streptomyces sp. NPDC017638 TaxID=3365004 RepID=UPI0037B8EAEF